MDTTTPTPAPKIPRANALLHVSDGLFGAIF